MSMPGQIIEAGYIHPLKANCPDTLRVAQARLVGEPPKALDDITPPVQANIALDPFPRDACVLLQIHMRVLAKNENQMFRVLPYPKPLRYASSVTAE